jgi:hypothetical protein
LTAGLGAGLSADLGTAFGAGLGAGSGAGLTSGLGAGFGAGLGAGLTAGLGAGLTAGLSASGFATVAVASIRGSTMKRSAVNMNIVLMIDSMKGMSLLIKDVVRIERCENFSSI